jgi:hypothetical protein
MNTDANSAGFDQYVENHKSIDELDALYSQEFRTLLAVDALSGSRQFHPIYVLGYSADVIVRMRSSYVIDPDPIKQAYVVKTYGVYEIQALEDRIGIPPSVLVLSPETEIVGTVRSFIKEHRIPVLRMQHERTELVALPNRDYYGGRVYETLAEKDIDNAELWTRTINVGLLVWLRTRGLRDNNTVVSLRDSKAVKRQRVQANMQAPASSFQAFAKSTLEKLGIDEIAQDALSTLPVAPESAFGFGVNDQ